MSLHESSAYISLEISKRQRAQSTIGTVGAQWRRFCHYVTVPINEPYLFIHKNGKFVESGRFLVDFSPVGNYVELS
jgi:hypothetical protein